MAKVNDKDGIRGIQSVSVAGATYGIGLNSAVAAAGLTAQTRSFTNYSCNDDAVFDSTETTAAVIAAEVTKLWAAVYSLGGVQNMVYNGTDSKTLG